MKPVNRVREVERQRGRGRERVGESEKESPRESIAVFKHNYNTRIIGATK